ncbi:MAG: hypothetical protein SGI74_10895 [Oligoflexia bacterium]|nr:hypothetical protein [Oligoflexia bacterium]
MKTNISLAIFLILFTQTIHAAQSEYLHNTHLTPRIMGMGGAFTAVADDYNALYTNVAGLGFLEEGELNFDIQGMFTPTLFNVQKDLKDAGSNPTAIQTALQKYYGEHFASRVGLAATWARPTWAVGFKPVDLSIEGDIHGTAGTTVGVQANQDSVLQYGKAWFFGATKSFSMGLAPKVVYRVYFEKDLTLFDFVQSSELFRMSDAQEGLAFDTDIGFMYRVTPPEEGFFKFLKYAKPTFGFAVRNVVDAGFKTNLHLVGKETSSITDAKLERRFDVGTKLELPEFWVFKPRVMIDARDMGTRYASLRKSTHIGAELLWKAFGWLQGGYRAGISQGYFTLGASAELSILRLDVATYSEEIGTSSSPRESRRYIAKLSLDF